VALNVSVNMPCHFNMPCVACKFYLIRLFQGFGEDNIDLDGEVQGNRIIGRTRPVNFEQIVFNTDEGRKDWAKVNLNVVNRQMV